MCLTLMQYTLIQSIILGKETLSMAFIKSKFVCVVHSMPTAPI